MNDPTTDTLRANYLAAKADLEAKRLALATSNASQTPRGAVQIASLRVAAGECEERLYSEERSLADALDADAGIDDADLAAHLENVRLEIGAKLADIAALEVAAGQLVASEAARRDAVNAARKAAGDPRVRRAINSTATGGWREVEANLRAPMPKKSAGSLAADRAALRAAQLALVAEDRAALELAAMHEQRARADASTAKARADDEAASRARARIAADAQRLEDDRAIAALEAR